MLAACTGAIEHAAWTKGERHLQPLRDDLNWFQTSSLDVMLFLAGAIMAALAIALSSLVFLGNKTVQLLQRNGILSRAKTA